MRVNLIHTSGSPAILGISSYEETLAFAARARTIDPTFRLAMAHFNGNTHESRMENAKFLVETATRLADNPITFDQVNLELYVQASLDWGIRPAVLFTFTTQDESFLDKSESHGLIFDFRHPADAAGKEPTGENRGSGAGKA